MGDADGVSMNDFRPVVVQHGAIRLLLVPSYLSVSVGLDGNKGKLYQLAVVANNYIWVGKTDYNGISWITQRYNLQSGWWEETQSSGGDSRRWCHPCFVKRQDVIPYNPRDLPSDVVNFVYNVIDI